MHRIERLAFVADEKRACYGRLVSFWRARSEVGFGSVEVEEGAKVSA